MIDERNPHPITVNRALWTASERAMGRVMRAPDGHDAGGGEGGGNNDGVITPPPAGESKSGDNTGTDDIDPATFWTDEEPSGSSPPAGDSAKPSGDSSSTDDSGAFGKSLVDRIDSLAFPEVFNADVAEQINKGDFKGVNDAITSQMRQAVKESMVTQVQMLRKFGETVTTQVQSMIDKALTGSKNSDFLTESIPSASNPKVAPAIRAIYDQALLKSGGDRAKAVRMTKQMMGTLAQEAGSDVGFDVAPRDPHAPSKPKPTNWLEELAAS